MALTQEQLDTLEKGTPIVIHTTFDHFDCDGDVRYKSPYSIEEENYGYIDPKYVSLPGETVEQPTPKYDPTRLFKKGDKVRVVKCKGRDFNSWARIVVDIDEMLDCDISVIAENGEENSIDPAYLELIIPVEDSVPYTVVHKPALQHFQINYGKLHYMTFPYGLYKSKGWYHTITTARDAAEDECKRLNDEWKQSHQN